MQTILAWIENVYIDLCNFIMDISDLATDIRIFIHVWARRLGIWSMILLTFAVLVVCLHWEGGILLLSVISSIVAIVAWYSAKTFAKSLKIIPIGTLTVKEISEELEKLISPICTLSLMLAFLAFWIGINGIGTLYTRNFLVIFLAVFFAAIAIVYFGKETKYAGKVMVGMVFFMLLQWAFPEQYRWINRAGYSTSQYAGSATDRYSLNRQADARATYAIAREDTVLYDDKGAATNMSIKTGQTVLVVEIKKDLPDNDGMTDPMVSVVLRDEHGNFANPKGTIYKMPRPKLGNNMVASNIYDDPHIKLPMVITLKKKGEFAGTLPFSKDTTVMVAVTNNPAILKFPEGGQVDLSIGTQPYTVKKGGKLIFEGSDDYESVITVSN